MRQEHIHGSINKSDDAFAGSSSLLIPLGFHAVAGNIPFAAGIAAPWAKRDMKKGTAAQATVPFGVIKSIWKRRFKNGQPFPCASKAAIHRPARAAAHPRPGGSPDA